MKSYELDITLFPNLTYDMENSIFGDKVGFQAYQGLGVVLRLGITGCEVGMAEEPNTFIDMRTQEDLDLWLYKHMWPRLRDQIIHNLERRG